MVPRHRLLLVPLLLVAAGMAVYANSLRGPFVFDDVSSIVDNPTLRRLWPPGEALSPPSGFGLTVSGRPVLNFSLAVNYAISGLEPWSYHALNLMIHLGAGLLLFGLVRRTLLRPALAPQFGPMATALALAVAGIWTLHPVQTESVTYVVQRAESLMGFFFLLTLYAFARSLAAPHPWRWNMLAAAACLLGIGTKETAALAPLIVLLYDRTFASGSFRAAWQQHRGRHLVLFATWLPCGVLLAQTGGNRGGTIGFDVGVAWSAYWLTQFEAVTRYVGLALWPHPLVFDYGKIAAAGAGATLLWATPVIALTIATAVGLRRRSVAGFCGAWFLLLLAPTSFVPGLNQMIVEHRMYLPLAAIPALLLPLAATWGDRRVVLGLALAWSFVLGVLTVGRNYDYASERTLWEDTLAKRPLNARAHNNLGLLLYREGKIDVALEHFRTSVALDGSIAAVHHNLGLALMRAGRAAEAAASFRRAIRLLPYFRDAHLNLGIVLSTAGQPEEALTHFTEALRLDPSSAESHFRTGVALAGWGRWKEAIDRYARAVQLDSAHAEAHNNWGVALFQLGALKEAIAHFDTALRLNPGLSGAHFNRALAAAADGRPADALGDYATAARLDPTRADARLNLGIALAQAGKLMEAMEHLAAAVRLRPDSAEAQANLGTALLNLERPAEALVHYETALRLRPDDPKAYYNLGYAQFEVGRRSEARASFEAALRISPDFAPAREMLRQIAAGGMP